MEPSVSAPIAGWYPDTQSFGSQRYWDGAAWTDQRRPADPSAMTVGAVPYAPVVGPQQVTVQQSTNGFAVAALVCGIVGVVVLLVLLFWLAWILGILAIVFGAMARRRAEREPAIGRRGMATAGLILGIIAVVLGIVELVAVVAFIDDVNHHVNSCFEDPSQFRC